MALFCNYCQRICDDRCELCKYKAEAIELEEDKDNEKDQASNS